MAEVFKRASKGAPIRRHLTSGAFNAFVDAANQVSNVQRGHISGAKQEQPASTVKVENGTGANLDRFSVIGLSAPAILDSEGSEYATRGLWSGVTPTADHLGKFAIYQEAVPAGFLGRAAVSGVVPCKLFVSATHGSVTHCDVDTSDSSRLKTESLGSARILWKSSTATNATVDAVVCLQSPAVNVTPIPDSFAVEFSSTTPSTPDTTVAPLDSTTTLDWSNSDTYGSSSKMSFVEADDAIEFSEGSYLTTIDVHGTNDTGEVHAGGSSTLYSSGNSDGHYRVAGFSFRFEKFDDPDWSYYQAGSYGYPGPDVMHQTASATRLLVVPSGGVKVRIGINNSSLNSADADIRVFHATWTTINLS